MWKGRGGNSLGRDRSRLRVRRLNDKVGNKRMENGIMVVRVVRVCCKVLKCVWGNVGEEVKFNVRLVCVKGWKWRWVVRWMLLWIVCDD